MFLYKSMLAFYIKQAVDIAVDSNAIYIMTIRTSHGFIFTNGKIYVSIDCR